MRSLRRLVSKVLDQGLKILSIDGGGVRGLFSALVLRAIMEAVRDIDTPEFPDIPKPCDYFDLMCGTSSGGLLAIMLGRLRMDVVACIREYRALAGEIFKNSPNDLQKFSKSIIRKPWFPGETLESITKGLVTDYLPTVEKEHLKRQGIKVEDAPLQPHTQTGCPTFVCARPVAEDRGDNKDPRPDRLRTYSSPLSEPSSGCKIWEAARATSAAPFYFPPMKINGIDYVDGGMGSNNPIREAVNETQQFGSISCIISIGTGRGDKTSPRGGLISLLRSNLSDVTDTEGEHCWFVEGNDKLRVEYSRLQEETDLGKIDLADWKKLEVIDSLAQKYLQSDEGREQILKCAKLLSRKYGEGRISEAPSDAAS